MNWFKAEKAENRTAKVVIDRAIGSDWAPDWISDFTGEKPARDFIQEIDALGELDVINLDLNSPGGDVASGIRIMHYLKAHPATVNVRVTGMAASIAVVVMLAGDTRTMGVGSTIMTHRASGFMGGYYTGKEMEAHAINIKVIDDAVVEAFAQATGKSATEINALLDKGDTFMGAAEAIEWGFATDKDAKLKAVAHADPGMFRQQLQMQGSIREAEAKASAAEFQLTELTGQFEAATTALEALTAELDAFKNPIAATADDVIARCSAAGFEMMAVAMAKEKLPVATVEARLKMAVEVQDIAKAGGIDAAAMLAHLNSPTQMLRSAISEAKALVDQDLDHHHKPGPGNSKQPDSKKAYSQLNNQA